MRTFGLILAGLLLTSTAFAADAAAKTPIKFSIKVKGKTIVTALMSDMPPGSDLVISSDSDSKARYNQARHLTTITGKSRVEVRQGEKTIFKMSIENGVVEIEDSNRPTE